MPRRFLVALTLILLPHTTIAQQNQVMPVLFLDGSGAHVVLPTALTDNLVNATVEAWVKWESLNRWSRVFDFGQEGNAAVLQNERETASLFFSIWDRSSKLHRAEAFKVIEVGKWQHMAIVCGKTGMQLYVNGELVGSNPYILPFNAVSGGTNYLGKSNWSDDAPFHGYIADLRVWSDARSQADIRQTMFTQLKGDEPKLEGYWRFEEAQGAESSDLTAAKHTAKLMQGASVMNAPGPPISKVSLEPEVPPGIPPADLHKIMLKVALRDHRIDNSETAIIEAVLTAGTLEISKAKEIEAAIRKDLGVGPQNPKEETFFKALESAHQDGILMQNEAKLLDNMKTSLALSDERITQLIQTLPSIAQPEIIEDIPPPAPEPNKKDSYRVLVRTALMDRKIDANEHTMLKQVALSDMLSEDEAQEVVLGVKKELGIGPQTEPEKTYYNVLKTALTDGKLSDTEEAMLQSMQTSLNLSDERTKSLKQDANLTIITEIPQEETK